MARVRRSPFSAMGTAVMYGVAFGVLALVGRRTKQVGVVHRESLPMLRSSGVVLHHHDKITDDRHVPLFTRTDRG